MTQSNRLTAETARNRTDEARSLTGEYLSEQTDAILIQIDKAARAGNDATNIDTNDEVILTHLRALGYTIRAYHGDQRVLPMYLTISW